jgi:hypothetical protein
MFPLEKKQVMVVRMDGYNAECVLSVSLGHEGGRANAGEHLYGIRYGLAWIYILVKIAQA